ncbi:MAG: DUF362 domain-containing protein [Candidatus Aminicenantes bacterium]|nr:DUF362 domain-containing protein [Candidatus Aminicenantes bacterium]
MKKKIITRRDFLRVAAMTPLAGALASGLKAREKPSLDKARVVLVRDKNALISFNNPHPEVIRKMLDEAVTTLLGEKDPVDAWRKLIKPSDIVGIKSNVWHYIPTGRVIEQAIKKRVMDAGVPDTRIDISDRRVRRSRVFKAATALINARPARTHHWSGLGTCLKNYVTFVSDIPYYHPDSCADLAKIWYLPQVKGKTRLNILIMLHPLFHGIGPHHFSRNYTWEYNGILVGKDPVAVDATGLRIMQAKRREFFGRERPLQVPAKHIFLADTRHGLGVSDPDRIELIKLGYKEGIFI